MKIVIGQVDRCKRQDMITLGTKSQNARIPHLWAWVENICK